MDDDLFRQQQALLYPSQTPAAGRTSKAEKLQLRRVDAYRLGFAEGYEKALEAKPVQQESPTGTSTTATSTPQLSVIPGGNQKLLATELLADLEKAVWDTKFQNMHNVTVVGVLEIMKMNYWASIGDKE